MEFLWVSLFADPVFYIGAALAAMGAMGFVFLLAGMSGLGHAIKENYHIDHLKHQRVRAVWGLYLMVAAYLAWKLVEWIASVI
jgi:hypothetical protein